MNALNYHTAASSNVISLASKQRLGENNKTAKADRTQLFKTHLELIEFCYGSICDAFTSMGAFTPKVSDLITSSNGFKKVVPLERKNRNKIGYAINCSWRDDNPHFILTVNNFKNGGHSATVRSIDLLRPLYEELRANNDLARAKSIHRPAGTINPSEVVTKASGYNEKTNGMTDADRQRVFQNLCNRFADGVVDLKHPYLQSKSITNAPNLKVCGDDVLIPLFKLANLDDRNVAKALAATGHLRHMGFQVIKPDASKKTYINKSGALSGAFMSVSGNINTARVIYIAEGYATADKVRFLSSDKDFCVLAAVSANNMPKVVSQVKHYFARLGKPVKFVIVADNDIKTERDGKGNAGLRCAFDALRIAGKDAKIIWPDCIESQTDFDDKYHQDAKAAKKAFKPLAFDRFDIVLKRASYLPKSDKLNNQGRTAIFDASKEFLAVCPSIFTFEQIVEKIYKASAHAGATFNQVKNICNHIYSKIETEACKAMTLTDQHLDEFVEVDTIEDAREAVEQIGKKALANNKGAVFLIDAPMGSGKTQKIIKPIFKNAEKDGYMPCSVYSTRSLTMSGASILEASHYERDVDHDFNLDIGYGGRIASTALCSTINSIINERFSRFTSASSVLVMDEASQIFRAIVSGTVRDYNRIATERFIASIINRSRMTLMTDADINDDIAEHVKRIKQDDVLSVGISLKGKAFTDTKYHFAAGTDDKLNHAILLERLIKDLKQGHNIYFAMDAKNHAKAVYEAAMTVLRPDEVLLVSSDTIDQDTVSAFLECPTDYVDVFKPRLVIATPSVQSGVSIEAKGHFTRGYGSFFREVLPQDFRQMLHRVRDLREFYLSLPCSSARSDQFNEDHTYLFLSAIRGEIERYSDPSLRHLCNIEVCKGNTLKMKNGADCFERLCASLTATACKQKNNAANYFLIQAKRLGVSLHNLMDDVPTDPDYKKSVKRKMKEFKEKVREKDLLDIVGLNTLSQADREAIAKKVAISHDERIDAKRYDIAQLVDSDVVTEDDVKLCEKHSTNKLRNYNLTADMSLAELFDLEEKNKNIALMQRSNKRLMVLVYYFLVSTLDLDGRTLEGQYDDAKAVKLREAILANETLLDFIRVNLKIKLTKTYKPILLVNMLLQRLFGLTHYKLIRSRGNDRKQEYALDQLEVSKFIRLANNQAKIDQAIADSFAQSQVIAA